MDITCVYFVLMISVLTGTHEQGQVLTYKTLKKPETCAERAKKLTFVTVHVTGATVNGLKIESTHDRQVPMEVQLGIGMLFDGLDEGIDNMCVGETRLLTIPPNKTKKARGKQKIKIPEDQTVEYEVELLQVSDFATMNAFLWLDTDDDGRLSEEEALEMIEMTFETSPQFPQLTSEKMLEMYMNMHDEDKDGYVSPEEYMKSSINAYKTKLNMDGQGAYKASKNRADKDSKGTQSREEL